MLASMCALLLACAGFVVYDLLDFRRQMTADLTAVADIVASNSSAALQFNVRQDGFEVLKALEAKPRIVGATLLDTNGDLFAHWSRDRSPPVPAPPRGDQTAIFHEGSLFVYADSFQMGDRVGSVVI